MSDQANQGDSHTTAGWGARLKWYLVAGAVVAATVWLYCAIFVVREKPTSPLETAWPKSANAYRLLPDVIRLHRLGVVFDGDGSDVTEVRMPRALANDEDLACLATWPHLRMVQLVGPNLSEAAVQNLRGLKELKALRLGVGPLGEKALSVLGGLTSLTRLELGEDISDEQLPYLATLKNLRRLEFHNSKVTDAGVPHLLDLKTLEYLWLNNSGITDEGVAQLAKLDSLQKLLLMNTKVTADCLRYIPELKKLRVLDVRHTAIHKADVTELRRTMPNLEIFVDHFIIQGDIERW